MRRNHIENFVFVFIAFVGLVAGSLFSIFFHEKSLDRNRIEVVKYGIPLKNSEELKDDFKIVEYKEKHYVVFRDWAWELTYIEREKE